MSRRLFSLAPQHLERAARLCGAATGTSMRARPERYAPVSDFGFFASDAGVPACTMRPPWTPAPGPKSITQSASRIVSSSCSTTTTVFPMSRRCTQRLEQALVVARVQADRGLVEDVDDAGEFRADLRCESDALRLAARERRTGAVEREVAEPHRGQEVEAPADLLQQLYGDLLGRAFETQVGEERAGVVDRERRDLDDGAARDAHGRALGAQPRAAAPGAGAVGEELRVPALRALGGALAKAAHQAREYTLPVHHEDRFAALLAGPLHLELAFAGTVQHQIALALRRACSTARRREPRAASGSGCAVPTSSSSPRSPCPTT